MAFNFNTPTTTAAATGFAFGQQPATTTASTGFGFGQQPATTAAAGGFGFGQTAATTVTTAAGFGFGQTGTTNTEAKPTFSFAANTQAPTDAAAKPFGSLGGFGAPAASTLTAATATATTKAAAPLSFLGQTATTTTAAPTFSFAPATATTTPTAATTSLSSGVSLQKTTTATGFPGATNTAPQATTGFASLTTATKTTDSSSIPTSSQISFNQIEEYINKWTMELEDQEKVFLDQATQINAWDRVINSNSSLILELNEAVQKVMSEQTTLECELAYIENQHRDVDENIQVLEKEFTKLPQVDVERSQAYLLVENLDTQLKQMSEDLKEIIDCLNEASQIGDSTDPIIQVGKILNAHMNSLQWIETTSAKVFKKLEDVGKAHEKYKRDNERSRNSYYR